MVKNAHYVANIANAIRNRGFRIGPPASFTSPAGYPPRWARVLVLLALPAALILLLRRLVPLGSTPSWAIFLILLVGGMGIAVAKRALLIPVAGLAAACVFPTLALFWAMQRSRLPALGLTTSRLIGRGVLALIGACAITLVGAVLIVGIYSPVQYIEGVGAFAGVKLAYLTPLMLAFAVAVIGSPGASEPLNHWWARVRLSSVRFASQPITIFLAIVAVIALGALAFAISRSGNQPAVAPTGGELKLRSILEAVLVVRPRTKEFLLGHPALMLLVALSLRGRRTWLPLVAVLAGIGQISVLNTFCHFHSPLSVSLLRTINGMWLGVIIGVAVVLVWRLVFDRRRRLSSP